jgi:hypothetical protein
MRIDLRKSLLRKRRARNTRGWRLVLCPVLLAVFALASPADTAVLDIVVGITPTCPYGISACWAGAYEALSKLEGVVSVDKNPDFYTSTAHIRLKTGGLPNPDKLRAQFESLVGKVYIFRGVEVTLEGVLQNKEGHTILQLPDTNESVNLVSLETKLQWNFDKQRPRGVESGESLAYGQLLDKTAQKAGGNLPIVRVTGPLKMTDKGPLLEVREFSMPKVSSSSHPED